MTINISVTCNVHHCITCGVPVLLPAELEESLRREGRAFRCPNGHRQRWEAKPQDPAADLAQRQEMVAALHRAEQAEAKAADMEARLLGRREGANENLLPAPPRRWTCPRCDKTYKESVRLGGHLRRVHQMSQKEIEAALLPQVEARGIAINGLSERSVLS